MKPRLIISLTSYPARIPALHLTLKTLLNQTKQADLVVLWLNPEHFPRGEADLPSQIIELKDHGLIIDWYHNIRSYTKLIPALKKFPDDIIVTADDDILYPENWLELLYDGYKIYPYSIQCHRAFGIKIKNNQIQPYEKWNRGLHINGRGNYGIKNIDTNVGFKSFFTGVSGVLYPPHCLHHDVFNEELFKKLAPTEDDVWFWAMAIRKGTTVNVVKGNLGILNVNEQSSQEFALYNTNSQNNTTHNAIWALFDKFPDIYMRIVKKSNIIISLTSFPQRINTVAPVIKSLLRQSVRADKIILWLASEQFPNKELDLPKELLELTHKGLIIDWCEDLKSYKKIIPCLKKYPNDTIVTVDDDILYPKNMLRQLIKVHKKYPNDICTHRIRMIQIQNGQIAPYNLWPLSEKRSALKFKIKHSFKNFCNTGSGTLFPAGALDSDVMRQDLFTNMCPHQDDVWLWAMSVKNNRKISTTRYGYDLNKCVIKNIQDCGLWQTINSKNNNPNNIALDKVLDKFPDIADKIKNGE